MTQSDILRVHEPLTVSTPTTRSNLILRNSSIDLLKRTSWNFFTGSQLTFGPNAVTSLTGIVRRFGSRRVFLVTGENLQDVGAVQRIEKAIGNTDAKLHVFTGGEREPSTDAVTRTAGFAHQFAPDLIVALGGGSNMDLAKAVAAVIANDCTAESLVGFDQVPRPSARLICLPSTSGTGSEVSHSAILKSSTTGKKVAILSQHIRPAVAVVDPYMTISCPAKVTAASGIDALTHAIEAYMATNFFQFEEQSNGDLPYEGNNPFGDMYAEKAIQLVASHLHKAVHEPENLTARSGMSLAATLAGFAFSNCGVGLCHALEYSIGSASDGCSHGAGNGIVLPEVIRFVADHRPDKMKKIATCINPQFAALPADEAAGAAVEFICELRRSIDLPTSLASVGITEQQLPDLARSAFGVKRLIDLTPGSPTEHDLLAILKACL
ncbi:iron-containing alcohol dehydrogenase [bacterium]|nr:iron-containing alcohol dehydrogenase [bacterium]